MFQMYDAVTEFVGYLATFCSVGGMISAGHLTPDGVLCCVQLFMIAVRRSLQKLLSVVRRLSETHDPPKPLKPKGKKCATPADASHATKKGTGKPKKKTKITIILE